MARFCEIIKIRWPFFGLLSTWQNTKPWHAIGQIFTVVNGQIFYKQCSHVVTLGPLWFSQQPQLYSTSELAAGRYMPSLSVKK